MADMFNIAINCNSLFNLAGLLIAAVTLIVYIRSICVAIYAGIKFLARYEKVVCVNKLSFTHQHHLHIIFIPHNYTKVCKKLHIILILDFHVKLFYIVE